MTEHAALPNGIGLEYLDQGSGPTVLLNGGMAMPLKTWDVSGLPQALVDAGFRVISYSARGVSGSDAPAPPYDIPAMADDTALLLDHCGVDSAIVVGYSMGCYVTQALIERRPALARGVVFCAGLASSAIGKLVNDMELDLLRRFGEVPEAVSVFETLTTTLPADQLQDAATVGAWRQILTSGPGSWTSVDGQHGQVTASDGWMTAGEPTDSRLAAIDVPTLVIAYEHDLFFPPVTSQAAAAKITDSAFHEIPGLSHAGLMLDPESRATALIVDFCRSLSQT